MGHMGVKRLSRSVDGAPVQDNIPFSCDICAVSNIKRTPFPQNTLRRAGRPNERVHTDICGPLDLGFGNSRYFMLIIDDYSRYSSVYMLSNRDQAFDYFIEYRQAAEKIHGLPIKYMRCDNAPEYVKGRFAEYMKVNGITYETTVPDAPPQNGVAERHNYTFGSMSRAMLLDADLSSWFWPFAVQTAVHIRNRLPHKSLPDSITPYQRWFNSRPNISYFRPFGAHCTARILTHTSKFDPRGELGRFLGYARNAKGYLFWHVASRSVKVRRDLVFHGPPTLPLGRGGVDYAPFTSLWDNAHALDLMEPDPDPDPPLDEQGGNGPSNEGGISPTNNKWVDYMLRHG